MPKPLPIYIPRELAAEIENGDYSGMAEYALSKGLSATRLNKLFCTNQHPRLMPWIKIARFAGVSLDELHKLVKAGKLERLVERLLWERGVCLAVLESQIGLSRDVLRAKLTKPESIKLFDGYADTARRLNWSLEKLASKMLRESDLSNAS